MLDIRIPQAELRHLLSAFDAIPSWPEQAAAKGAVKQIIKTPDRSYQSDRPRHSSLSLSCIGGAALPSPSLWGARDGLRSGFERSPYARTRRSQAVWSCCHQKLRKKPPGLIRSVGGVHGRFPEAGTAAGCSSCILRRRICCCVSVSGAQAADSGFESRIHDEPRIR